MIRWFNKTIENVPLTLTLLIGGCVVMPIGLAAYLWAAINIVIGAGHAVGLH